MTARGSVVTVGTFDGLHRGHLALVDEVLRRAAAAKRRAVLVTFEPHPASTLEPGGAPARLTLREERTELLAQSGLAEVVVLRFDHDLAALSAERFVRDVLQARYDMRELVAGEDHRFGRDREGDRKSLPALGKRIGFEVAIVPPVNDGTGAGISSTAIRRAVADGELGRAAEWLGRPYTVSGTVVRGAGRGATIGMPTINLEGPPAEKALPPDGVWAAWVEWRHGVAGAMLNQGTRPTVGDLRRSLEAHLFGVSADLYGQRVRIEWVARLRDTVRFPSIDALKAQLAMDRENAQAILAPGPWTSMERPVRTR
jgi:riboflavin kinase/FMN adenylyltransferase